MLFLFADRFDHYAIDSLDMERDFTAEVCLAWIASLRGSTTTRLRYAQAAKQMFRDCIMFAWIDPTMANPFDREIVKRELRRLANEAADDRPIIFLTADQAAGLLTIANSKVSDFRRLRYLIALATGMRDHEIQGLVWSDFNLDAAIPYAWVDRQLLKIGPKPFVNVTDLKKLRMPKADMMSQPNALVAPPKMKSRRPVPLLPIVVAALRHWWRVGWEQHTGFAPGGDDPVSPSSSANRHSPAGQFCFSESPELLRLDLERLGLPTTFTPEGKSERIDFDFHALRHTFATLLEVGGVERSMIGALLGHKAADVASGHYIGEMVEARARHVATLRIPPRVQLVATMIEAEPHAGWHEAKDAAVIPLRQAKRRTRTHALGQRK